MEGVLDLRQRKQKRKTTLRWKTKMAVSITSMRRVCIGLIAIGTALLFFQSDTDTDFGTLPFPGAGFSVKMGGEVKTEGNYHLTAGMPITNEDAGLAEETVPCSLAVRITQQNHDTISNEVTSLVAGSEFGFSKVENYTGGSWHLKPGKYDVEVKSLKGCKAAMSRGATISFEKEITKPTEQYLQGVLRHWCGVWFLWGGTVGIVLCEFRKPRQNPLPH